jgi:hypothetical protein
MKLKHTPGPWKFSKNQDYPRTILFGKDRTIFEIFTPIEEKHKADLRIISCAPEMLELLLKLVKNPAKQEHQIDELIHDAHCKGRELIERATGLTIEEVIK